MTQKSFTTVQEVFLQVREILSLRSDLLEKGVVQSEAEQIVLHVLFQVQMQEQDRSQLKPLSRSELYFRMQESLPQEVVDQALSCAQKRAQGFLLQHVLGIQFFLNHLYEVNSDVLIPRPETEVLVSQAIQVLEKEKDQPRLGIEIGLGSGILSIELLSRFSNLSMYATELSRKAERVALRNAQEILGEGVSRLQILSITDPLDVCESLLKQGIQADFLISNPPYLLDASEEVEAEVSHYEPHSALFAPLGKPCYFYEEMAAHGMKLMKPNGKLFLELPHERSQDIVRIFQKFKWEVQVILDLTGRDRVVQAQWRGREV